MTEHLTLADYIDVFRRRWFVVAAVTLGAALVAIIWTLTRSPLYRAESQVLVNNRSASQRFDPTNTSTNSSYLTRSLENEVRFIGSDQVQKAADEELRSRGVAVTPGDKTGDAVTVTTNRSDDADEVSIVAVSTSATDAVTIAEVYTETYIDLRSQNLLSDFIETAEVVQTNIDQAQAELDALGDEESAQRRVLESRLAAYSGVLDDLNVSIELGGSRPLVIRQPRFPEAPFSPQTARTVALASIVGVTLGSALALLREALDNKISGRSQLEAITGNIPTFAVVPQMREWKQRSTTKIATLEDPQSPLSESYRVLRSALDFAVLDSNAKIFQFTSANPGEGKTTTAVNLAVAIAQTGRVVGIVDGDLRKPRLHEFFDVPPEPGFTNVILGQTTFEAAATTLHPVGSGTVHILPAGLLPPGPSEVLGSERTAEVILDISDYVDIVLIDSAPTLPVSDALALSRSVDGTVLVVNSQRTTRQELEESLERLSKVDAKLTGAVLNEVHRSQNRYGYGYGYGQDTVKGNDRS